MNSQQSALALTVYPIHNKGIEPLLSYYYLYQEFNCEMERIKIRSIAALKNKEIAYFIEVLIMKIDTH